MCLKHVPRILGSEWFHMSSHSGIPAEGAATLGAWYSHDRRQKLTAGGRSTKAHNICKASAPTWSKEDTQAPNQWDRVYTAIGKHGTGGKGTNSCNPPHARFTVVNSKPKSQIFHRARQANYKMSMEEQRANRTLEILMKTKKKYVRVRLPRSEDLIWNHRFSGSMVLAQDRNKIENINRCIYTWNP